MKIFSFSQPGRLRQRRLVIQLLFLMCVLLVLLSLTSIASPSSFAARSSAQTTQQTRTATPIATVGQGTSPRIQSPNSISKPQSVPGQLQVDANTVALYHFDAPNGNLAIDATGQFTGTLEGNATITTSGLYAGVLMLDGNGSYVRLDNLGNLSQGTVEAYVDFANVCEPNAMYSAIVSAGTGVGGNSDVLLLDASTLFKIYANGRLNQVDSGVNPCRYLTGGDQTTNFGNWGLTVKWPYETWRFHHIAATWGPRGMEAWIDGVLYGVGVTADPPPPHYVYYCNPQLYVSSPLYPYRCLTPVPAPQMPSYPPGDYTGGLPAYNTFQIGCNSSGNCFKGRIDEVRISNIQRTFEYTVVPTVTPTPTQTPVPILGEYAVDGNTIALYHLNFQNTSKVLDEVTQQYNYLEGAASIVPNGRFGGGLTLDGNGSYLNPGNLTYFNSGTIETWLKMSESSGNQPLFSAAQYYNSQGAVMEMWMSPHGSVYLDLFDGTGSHEVNSDPIISLTGCWHHVAGTWGARGMEIWVDGMLRGTNTSYSGGMYPQISGWRIGCDFAGICTKGLLDEVRVSKVQRRFTVQALAAHRAPQIPLAIASPFYLPLIQIGPTVPIPPCPFGN